MSKISGTKNTNLEVTASDPEFVKNGICGTQLKVITSQQKVFYKDIRIESSTYYASKNLS